MPEREPTSTTPILDLAEPLPKPLPEGIRPRTVIALGVITLSVALFHNLPLFAVIPAYFAISLAVAIVHELGHWLAGRCVGLRLAYLAIGPVLIKRDSSRWKLRWRRHLTGGLILMSLDRVRRMRRRLIVWVAGGPAASLITGTAALISCRVEAIGGNPAIGLPLAGYAILSLLAGIQSVRRLRFGRYAGDGMVLRALLSYQGAKQQIAAHALYRAKIRGVDRSEWKRRWMAMAAAPTELLTTKFHTDWLRFQLANDPATAAQCLESCLAESAQLTADEREESVDELFLEAAIFQACQRNDAAKAEVWFNRAEHPERAVAELRLKAEIALDWARGEFNTAHAKLERGVESMPQNG